MKTRNFFERIAHGRYFLKSDEREFAYGCSLQKSDQEQFPQVVHDKRAMGTISSFSRANCSFALSFTKSKRIARKTNDQIPSPANKTVSVNTIFINTNTVQQLPKIQIQQFPQMYIQIKQFSYTCKYSSFRQYNFHKSKYSWE